jgi:hypothetical protein
MAGHAGYDVGAKDSNIGICRHISRSWLFIVCATLQATKKPRNTERKKEMASRFSKGDYVAQIFAYEADTPRLLQKVQQYVSAGNVLYAAIFTCRYSGNPSAIEKRAITAGSSRRPHYDLDRDRSTKATSAGRQGHLDGDLTLSLLHIDTTWRFDDFENRQASPMLSWPAIRKFFTPGAFVEGDLILKDQYLHPDTSLIPRKSYLESGNSN